MPFLQSLMYHCPFYLCPAQLHCFANEFDVQFDVRPHDTPLYVQSDVYNILLAATQSSGALLHPGTIPVGGLIVTVP